MTTSPETNRTEYKAFKMLERTLWQATELIGQAWSSTISKLDDKELAAYAEGVNYCLQGPLEDMQHDAEKGDPCLLADGCKWHDQLRAAVGEQLRRRHPGERCCPGRKLNKWLETIRDWRIKMVDECDTTPFEGHWRKKPSTLMKREMESWRRRAKGEYDEGEAMKFERVKEELSALHEFFCYLLGDAEWSKKRWRNNHPSKPVSVVVPPTTPHATGCAFLTFGGHHDCPRCRELAAKQNQTTQNPEPRTQNPEPRTQTQPS